MKKILFLLLSTIAMYGQVPADATQLENIQITNNVQDLTADKVNVQSTNGVLNWQLINDFQNNKPYFSTGLLKNGLLTINADNTKFNLSAGIGVYSDFSDPENVTSKVFNFPAFNAVLSPYLATSNITYVAVNYNGGSPVLVMQASKFSNTQLRDLVVVGAVVHSNFTTINTINNISSPSNDVGNSVADLFNFLGAKNQEGNVYSANGANLQLNKSAGIMLKYGANFHVNAKNPHNVSLPEQLSLTFRYRLQGGFEGTDRINVDTDNYDSNNVLTTVPPAKPYQIQTIFIPQTGQTRIQYGQTTYNTLADAVAAINTRKFIVETNLASQFVKVAYLVVKKGATSLNVAADADIRQATQFDGTASGGVALTYQSIIDALGYVPENVANKVADIAVGANNTTYPTSLAVKTYADNLVVGMLNDRGSWDASVNLFPTTGGSGAAGAIRKGDMWYISIAGILGGKSVNVGDSFRALVNAPAQVASNWSVLEANIGYVPENVSNKTSSFLSNSAISYPSSEALFNGLATKEPTISPKNSAFNKNFGTTAGTVVEGGTLGTNAYTSTAYLPLSGNSTITGVAGGDVLTLSKSTGASLAINGATGTIQPVIIATSTSTTPDLQIYVGGSIRQTIAAVSGAATFSSTITASPATVDTELATLGQAKAVASSGTYTPTLTGVENINTLTLSNASYTRVGNVVSVSVGYNVSVSVANTASKFTISLPINRGVSSITNVGTTAFGTASTTSLGSGFIQCVSSSIVNVNFSPNTTGALIGNATFQYSLN